jgi:hypothetical protein
VNVVRRPGEAGTEARDDWLQFAEEVVRRSAGVLDALNGTFDLPAQSFEIEGQKASVANDPASIDHDMADGGGVLCLHELMDRIANWQPMNRTKVDENDVGPIARLEPSDVLESENPRAPLRRGKCGLASGHPPIPVDVLNT